jgi:hypothetical protein
LPPKTEENNKNRESFSSQTKKPMLLLNINLGQRRRVRDPYHGETEMIKPKPCKSYVWNDRKGAKKPKPAIKDFYDQEIANIFFVSKLINKAGVIKLSIEL